MSEEARNDVPAHRSADRSADRAGNRSAIRRTTWIMVIIALAFYLGFIMIGVLRS